MCLPGSELIIHFTHIFSFSFGVLFFFLFNIVIFLNVVKVMVDEPWVETEVAVEVITVEKKGDSRNSSV